MKMALSFLTLFGTLGVETISLIATETAPISSRITFKERITKAKNGDYFVIEANKMITLIAVRASNPHTLLIEEISAPSQNFPKQFEPGFWTEWVKKRAPGHTSWAMIEIDLHTSQILECYSFSKGAWLQLSPIESLFSTLLQLSLEPISLDKRRKIGPPPLNGEADMRQLWEPNLIFEGKKKTTTVEAFETEWPSDGSELAGKSLSLYFGKEGQYPFPLWIQVEAAGGTAQVRTIDMGRNFLSPHRNFPRRVPQFVGTPKRSKTGLTLHLKSPQYYRNFELYAVEITPNKREICPVTIAQIDRKEESLILQIEEEELQNTLKKDHRYTWLLVPIGYSESYTETSKDFVWR